LKIENFLIGACLRASIPACLPACPPASIPASLRACLPARLGACLPARLRARFWASPPAVAYISGVLGVFIGADLLNLKQLSKVGRGVMSIGGAGVFDGIYLVGIIAVLIA